LELKLFSFKIIRLPTLVNLLAIPVSTTYIAVTYDELGHVEDVYVTACLISPVPFRKYMDFL
jgi:hypothetical protein